MDERSEMDKLDPFGVNIELNADAVSPEPVKQEQVEVQEGKSEDKQWSEEDKAIIEEATAAAMTKDPPLPEGFEAKAPEKRPRRTGIEGFENIENNSIELPERQRE